MEMRALAGFLVSGFLLSLPGAILPAWGYDVSGEYGAAGRYFLAIVLGMAAAGLSARRAPQRAGTRTFLVAGCGAAVVGLVGVAILPDATIWRLIGIFIVGVAAGLLHKGLFQAISPAWDRNAATALIVAGIFFGVGSIICAVLVSSTFYAWPVERILLILALVPAVFAFIYSGRVYPPVGLVSHPKVLSQFRSGLAILFSLLLFFQFGNEWSIAGWLPLFLIHRLGVSPASALEFLAMYFAALTLGRIAIYYLLPRVSHWRLLATSAAASLFGCMVMAATDNRFGATVAMLFLGFGFAATYPVVAAWIGRRFPYYHPGFFNGIFSAALTGGMLAPWILGEIAGKTTLGAVMILPAIGTCLVMLLLCLIWVHGKVTGE
jgi:FHS family glucose/mannose:H+ symporter-like MFS transporter